MLTALNRGFLHTIALFPAALSPKKAGYHPQNTQKPSAAQRQIGWIWTSMNVYSVYSVDHKTDSHGEKNIPSCTSVDYPPSFSSTDSSHCLTVFISGGTRHSEAIRDNGSSAKRRTVSRGCGTCNWGSETTRSPNSSTSKSSVRLS